MKCAIMQPTYLPWLGYFDIIDQVDRFVFLDNVQLVKRDWGVRNRIKTAQGELYLTLPIQKIKHRDNILFSNAHIDYEQSWQKKHLKSIQFAYKKAPYFDRTYSFIEKIINKKYKILSTFNINIIKKISRKIGIKKRFTKASELKNITGRKDTLLTSICKAINCNNYLSPLGATVYIERKSPGGEFVKNKIDLCYQNYEHPSYNQLYGDFLSHLSIVDLLFNCGFNKSLKIIRSGRRKPIHYQKIGGQTK